MKITQGIDITTSIPFQKYSPSSSFLRKTFTPRELAYCFSCREPSLHLAGRWAAKEAICKAFSGLGISIKINEVEIVKTKKGVNQVVVKEYEDYKISVSLSYGQELAIAACIVMTEENILGVK